ncbi:MAG: DUF1592 domain-containing protein [Fimbriimonadaceae bacterium]|nr:DUF1592 domain-containing protein [Fimbriimonadaceae bacterium]
MQTLRTLAMTLGAGLLTLGVLFPAPAQTKKKPVVKPTFETTAVPVLKKFCIGCHTGKDAAGGLDLAKYKTGAVAYKDPDVWDRVIRNVASGHMPPRGAPAPTDAQRKQFTDWLSQALAENCKVADPGRVTIRRLNRAEYDNTIRDLLGVDFQASADFPSDDVGHGFDNIGDVLSMSPLLLEKYLRAAEQIASKAIILRGTRTYPVDFEMARLDAAGRIGDAGEWLFFANGKVAGQVDIPRAGQYILRVRAWGQQAGPDPCKMSLIAGNKVVATVSVTQTRTQPGVFEAPLSLGPGKIFFGASFDNDYYNPQASDPKLKGDRNLIIESIEVVGPLGHDTLPPSHLRLVVARPEGEDWMPAARKCLTTLVARAFRRPARADEIDRLLKLVASRKAAGESFEEGLRIALQAILVSPNFLFRVEESKTGVLDSYQIASRLSYFLWSSMPDATLFDLAAKGSLTKPEIIVQQALRMLKDPKAAALADNFASQWLQLRKLEVVSPDRKLFPGFDERLKDSMRQETILFFQNIVSEDRSVLEFLDSRTTFIDGALAKHYGITGVEGPQFRKVTLTDPRRGGLLTQASVLTVTSNPTRTSPVKRGKWVLENLLGTPPPPPPPGAGDLPDAGPNKGKTVRERLEIHRQNPECASCHARMDPIGFGLENFDATGSWRTVDDGQPIDTQGQMPDGSKVDGPQALRQYLLAKKDLFVHAFAEKMLTYALGRGLSAADKCHVDEIATLARKGGYKFSAVIRGVVESPAFRRQGK